MALHSFNRMEDASFLAFFEEPEAPFDFTANGILTCILHLKSVLIICMT